MTDADILRRQMATSTDPDRLDREALRAEALTFVPSTTQTITLCDRADLAEAKRHIETLTGFYMDNVLWTRAAEEARAFVRSLEPPTYGKGIVEQITDAQADVKATYFGVSG